MYIIEVLSERHASIFPGWRMAMPRFWSKFSKKTPIFQQQIGRYRTELTTKRLHTFKIRFGGYKRRDTKSTATFERNKKIPFSSNYTALFSTNSTSRLENSKDVDWNQDTSNPRTGLAHCAPFAWWLQNLRNFWT